MTVTPIDGTFTFKPVSNYVLACDSPRSIPLPGKPYQAIRLRKVAP